MGGACLTSWKQNLVERSEVNSLLGRPLQRRGDDIKVDIEERSWGVVRCVLHSCDRIGTNAVPL